MLLLLLFVSLLFVFVVVTAVVGVVVVAAAAVAAAAAVVVDVVVVVVVVDVAVDVDAASAAAAAAAAAGAQLAAAPAVAAAAELRKKHSLLGGVGEGGLESAGRRIAAAALVEGAGTVNLTGCWRVAVDFVVVAAAATAGCSWARDPVACYFAEAKLSEKHWGTSSRA